MRYQVWFKEPKRNWRRCPPPHGWWKNKDKAIEYAKSIVTPYVQVTVEDELGAVVFRQ